MSANIIRMRRDAAGEIANTLGLESASGIACFRFMPKVGG